MKFKFLAAALTAFLALPALAEAASGFATANVNMRSGPSTAYPAVVVIPVGARLEIYGCLSQDAWCDVSFAGGRGWVAGRYIQATYNSRRIYVDRNYYQRLGIPVIQFDIDNYWGRHYRQREFYRDRDTWRRGPPRQDWNDDRRPPPRWSDDRRPPQPGWNNDPRQPPGWDDGRRPPRQDWNDNRRPPQPGWNNDPRQPPGWNDGRRPPQPQPGWNDNNRPPRPQQPDMGQPRPPRPDVNQPRPPRPQQPDVGQPRPPRPAPDMGDNQQRSPNWNDNKAQPGWSTLPKMRELQQRQGVCVSGQPCPPNQ